MMSDQQAKITISAEEQGVSQVLKTVEALEKKIADLEKQLKSYDKAVGALSKAKEVFDAPSDSIAGMVQRLKTLNEQLQNVSVGTRAFYNLKSEVDLLNRALTTAKNSVTGIGDSTKASVSPAINSVLQLKLAWKDLEAQASRVPTGSNIFNFLSASARQAKLDFDNAKKALDGIKVPATAKNSITSFQEEAKRLNDQMNRSDYGSGQFRKLQRELDLVGAKLKMMNGDFKNYGAIGPVSQYGPKTQYGSTGPVSQYGTGGGQNGPYMFGFPTASQVAITEKANAEYARLYGNTAKVAQAQQQAAHAVEKHTSSWTQHIAQVAGGIILYQAVREAMRMVIGFFYEGVKAVSDYEDAIIGMSAMWTTLAKDQSNIPETFKLNVQYAKELVPVMQEIDLYSGMNLDQLLQMNMAFATQGVVLNKNNQDQIQGYTNISNAILFLTKGQSSSRQIQQEIKSVMQGQLRDSDALAKILASQIGPEYKKQIASWIAIGKASGDTGFVIGKIGENLKGYTAAMDMMQGSWSVMISSLKTTWSILERDVFTPILEDWKVGLKATNEYLRAHSKEISTNIYEGWVKVKGVLKLVKDNIDGITLAAKGLMLIFAATTATKVISEITLTFGKLTALATGAWAAISMGAAEATLLIEALGVSTGGVGLLIVGVVAAVGTAIYAVYKNWNYLVSLFEKPVDTGSIKATGTEIGSVKTVIRESIGLVGDLWTGFMNLETTKTVLSEIKSLWNDIADGIKTAWQNFSGFMGSKVEHVLTIMTARLKEMREALGVQASQKAIAAKNAANNYSNDSENNYANTVYAKGTPNNYLPQLGSVNTDPTTRATKAEKNLSDERERMIQKVDNLIGNENFLTKAIQDEINGKKTLKEAFEKGYITSDRYAEGIGVIHEKMLDTVGKPMDDIIKKYANVEDSSKQYADSLDVIKKHIGQLTDAYDSGKLKVEDYRIELKKAQDATATTTAAQIADIDKIAEKYTELKNDTGGYVKSLESLQKKLENASEPSVIADIERVNGILLDGYNKEVMAKYGVILATTKSVEGNKKLIASTNAAIKKHDDYVKSMSSVLNEVGSAAGLSSGFITNMVDALDEFNKGALLGGKNLKGIASAIQAIGSQSGGRLGDALVGLGVGFKAILSGPVLNADGTTNQAATDMSQIGGYAAIGQNIGALIGGSTGQKISSTVTGIAAGMGTAYMLGAAALGPIGIAAGALGGALGLFGGGDDAAKKAAKATGIQEQEKAIADLAESGSTAARYIMQLSNYDMGNVSEIDSRKLTSILPKSITGAHYKSDYRLLGMDYEGKGSDTVEFLTALDGIDKAFRAISESSIVTELDDITYKYQMIGAKIGDNADLWAAKLSEQMLLLTGFSVDSTSSLLDEIITSTDPSKVGDAFTEKMTEGLATSLRQMEISKFATTLAEQTLTPLYEEATRMMLSGGDSSTALAAVNDGLISVSQQVTEFAQSLTDLGISGYNAAGSTTALTTATTAADVATARLSYQISLLSGTEKDAAATAAEAWGIENELIALLGDTVSARERELALLSPLNRALKEMVYAISDAQSVAQSAASNLQSAQSKADAAQSALDSAYNALNGNVLADAKTAVSNALSALSDTINAQKESLTEQYNAATELINSQVTAAKTTLSAAESISSSSKSFLSAMTSETLFGRIKAQSDLSGYLDDAQRGILPESKKFSDTLSVLSQDSQKYFSNSVDWARDYYMTANKVSKIGGIAETKKTEAQKAITVAEEQLSVMVKEYENSIASLEAQYVAAEAQVAALDRVNTSVMSLSDALLAYKNAQAETGSSVTSSYEKALANYAAAQAELAAAQQENTTAQATLTAAMNAAAEALASQKATDMTAAKSAPVSIANTAANELYSSVFGGVTETQISAFTADATSSSIGSAVKEFWLNPSVLEKINASSDPLEEAYRLVLGRASDQEGKSFWKSQMATGATISNVITEFLKSLEYSKIKNVRGYATGGIAEGPSSGYLATLHGTEAVVPLSNGRSIPVNIDFKEMVGELKSLREEVTSLRAEVAKGNNYAKDTADATSRMNRVGIKQISS